jgi:Stage II sporulation protein E (SpoIIE)/GAF domain
MTPVAAGGAQGTARAPRLPVGGNLAAITAVPRLSLRTERGEDRPFDRLVRLAAQVLRAPLAVVAVLEEEQVYLNARFVGPLPALDPMHAMATAFAQRIARAGVITMIADAAVDARTCDDPWILAMGLRGLAAYPIEGLDGDLLGTLFVADTEPRDWTADDLAILASLADLGASKVTLRGAARRADAMAELLQHSMLTDLPQVSHIQLVSRYLPAQDSAQVGGDWYDAFVLPDGVTALVIGDVAGHDMPAAAQMGQLRNLLRGIAWHTNPAPHAVIAGLDTTAHGLGVTDLATAVYARIEAKGAGRWQLRWANAGHPPPLLVTTDGQIRYLDHPSGVLLAFGDSHYDDGTVALPPLSTLLLYTDGLVESRHRDIDLGLKRLRTTAAQACQWPLEQFCDHVLSELALGQNEDDVTLLAVRVPLHHPDGRLSWQPEQRSPVS